MGTKHIVPRAEGQGGIGTATLGWGELFITNTTADSSTQGGKLTLTSNDGNAMQSGSRLGVIEFKGAESSSALTIGARIEAICDAAWTATENGASLKFYTTDANASESLVLTLDSNKLATFTGSVAISADISAVNATLTGYLRGPASFVIDPSTHGNDTGTVVIAGNLQVDGTTTTVNSTIVTIDDPVFTLGGDTPPASETTKDKGIEFRYHTGSAAKIGFFGWDDSASAFTFIADATNNSEVFSGTAGNAIFTNITGTLQTAAQTNITSVGALDGGTITSGFGAIDNGSSTITTTGLISGGSLDIDNVLINGTTIGHTDDTDLMTLSSGVLTVAGELDAVSLDISGDADIDGTLNVTETLTVDKTATSAIEIAKFKVSGTGGSSGNESFVSILPGSNNFTTQLRLNTNNTGSNFQTVSNKSGVLELATTDSNPIVFKTNDSTRLTISNAGVFTFTNNIIIPDSGTIGCASDTDLLTLASASLTVAGKSDITTSVSGFASTITNNKDDSQGLLVRTSDNDGGEYILDLQSSSSATGTNYASKFKVAKGGAATFSGNVEIDTNGGDGALGGTLKLSSTNTNVSARNWALINTWDNYGDLTFRVGNAQGDNPLTSGSTKMVIKPGGNVGIGINPSTKFQVNDGQDINLAIKVGQTNTSAVMLNAYNNGATANIPMEFRASSFAFQNGNVGIGTADPSNSKLTISDGVAGYSTANVLLQVKRNATNSNDDTSRSAIMLANNSNAFTIAYGGATDRLRFINGGGNEQLTLLNGGNVGVGTTSPSRELHIEKSTDNCIISAVSGTTRLAGLVMGDTADDDRGAILYNNNGDYLYFISNGSERLRISSGGDTTLTASYSGNTFPFRVGYLDGSSTYTPTFVIEDNGKVGIGLSVTDPVKTLDVRGQLAISNNASSYWYLDRNDSSGNFDIINDSNQVKLTIASNGVATFSNYIDTPEVRQGGEFMIGRSSNIIRIGSGDGSDSLSFYAGGSERLTISSGGAIGQSVTPISDPYVAGAEQWMTYQIGKGGIIGAYKNNNESMFGFNTYVSAPSGLNKAVISGINGTAIRCYADRITFNHLTSSGTSQTQSTKLTISSGGNVGIGEPNAHRKLNVASGTNGDGIYLSGLGTTSGMATDNYKTLEFAYSDTDTSFGSAIRFEVANDSAHGGKMSFWTDNSSGTLTRAITIFKDQSVTFAGTVNVSGTKNFYIDHPLESKKDTHSLIHSSVESPEVNNLYRGKVDLVNGNATVNLDTVSNMTEGTFVALNDNTQCFTTNETNWDAVKGSVDGNELTISCQNSSSTANVSWMVIANRKDIAIMESSGTDSNGNLIVEEVKA